MPLIKRISLGKNIDNDIDNNKITNIQDLAKMKIYNI